MANKVQISTNEGTSGQVLTSNGAGASPTFQTVSEASHNHDSIYYREAEVDNFLSGKEPTISKNSAFNKNFGNATGEVTEGDDPRLSDEREWTASTVLQSEAEAGTATVRRGWTAERVKQAINALQTDTQLTDSEVKTAYENNADTNAYTDSEKNKLGTIESGATTDQTDAEIETAYNNRVDVGVESDITSPTTGIKRWAGNVLKSAIESIALLASDVVDNLTSTDTDKPLSANQGKELEDKKSDVGHDHDASDITSGTFADGRIAASNVTQHQTSLTITESQISDLGSYETTLNADQKRKITYGTAAPSGGVDGDIYLQHD